MTTHEYGGPNVIFRTKTTNALGHVARWTWDDACQAPLTAVDVNGQTTSFAYDQFCREKSQTLPGGHVIETFYRNFGNPVTQHVETSEDSAAEGSPKKVSRSYFDGLGQVWKTARTGRWSGDSGMIVTRSSYDRRGNLDWRSLPYQGLSPEPEIPESERTTYSYDGQDRLTKTAFADGNSEKLYYELTSHTVPSGASIRHCTVRFRNADCFSGVTVITTCGETQTVYGGRGWGFRQAAYDSKGSDVGSGGGAAGWRNTTYTRDPLGRTTGIRDPRGSEWRYVFDKLGDLTVSDDPDLGRWTMEYDASHNLTRQTDAKGQVQTFTWDLLDRQKTKVAGGVTITSTYDQARTGFYNVGALTTLADGSETIAYDYARLGGLAEERHTLDGRTYRIVNSFLSNGLVNGVSLPANASGSTQGLVGSYAYDAANRPKGFGTQVTDILYNLWDAPSEISYGNGIVEERTHSAKRGWLERVVAKKNDDVRLDTRLTAAASGLITRQNTLNAFGRFDYRYDYAGRVTLSDNFGDKDAYDQAFTYDTAGSIRSKSNGGVATAYAYPAADAARPHAPLSVGGAAFAYDANGNMTTGLGGKVMTYDAENRVKTAALGGVTTTYAYGADGTRRKRRVDESTTLTIGPIEVRNYRAASGEAPLLYPTPWFRMSGSVMSAFHRDQVESVQAITGGGGGAVKITTYQPFGEARDAVVEAPIAPAETHGYVGERFDEVNRAGFAGG